MTGRAVARRDTAGLSCEQSSDDRIRGLPARGFSFVLRACRHTSTCGAAGFWCRNNVRTGPRTAGGPPCPPSPSRGEVRGCAVVQHMDWSPTVPDWFVAHGTTHGPAAMWPTLRSWQKTTSESEHLRSTVLRCRRFRCSTWLRPRLCGSTSSACTAFARDAQLRKVFPERAPKPDASADSAGHPAEGN